MKHAGLLLSMIAASLWTAPLAAAQPPADPPPAAAAPAAPAATPQDDDEEPDPALRPDVHPRSAEARFVGASLAASLTTLDGATLQLPRAALGKLTLLHFWSTQGIDIPRVRALYDQYHHQGLEIIGINIDRNREEVEAFIRQQGLAWPQVFSGKGAEDPLLTRLTRGTEPLPRSGKRGEDPVTEAGVPRRPYWLIGWDGRVAGPLRRDHSAAAWALDLAVSSRTNIRSDLDDLFSFPRASDSLWQSGEGNGLDRERFCFYRSGEFLAVTPLLGAAPADAKSTIPAAALDAIRAKLGTPGWTAGSQADRIRSFQEVLVAGQALAERYPDDPNLPVVRSWMLIAARWLAITTGEKALGGEAVAIAKGLLASRATPAARLLADYVATSARLAERKPRTRGGRRQIQDYVARHAGSDAACAARVLAVMLALEDAQNGLREELVEQLRVGYEHRPGPVAYAFLRDCCAEKPPAGPRAQPPLAEKGASAPGGAVKDTADDLCGRTDLARRLPASFYRSAEFLILTELLPHGPGDPKAPRRGRRPPASTKDAISKAEFDVLRAKLIAAGRADVSPAEKVQSYKDLLAAGQALEQRHPAAAGLALVRSWMMIAARWLAITTADKAFHEQATATANRVLAGDPAGPVPVRILADYIVTSAQLAGNEPRSQAGLRLIQDYAARYAAADDRWLVQMLAIMLTFDAAEDGLREQLTAQFRSMYGNRPGSWVYGFLRDCGDKKCEAPCFHARLTRMDGRPLVLPDDLLGKVVIIQFWSAAHPPTPCLGKIDDDRMMPYTGTASVPSEGVVVVGVNLDRSRADAEAFLKKSRYPDWIHTFSSLGWDDPTARTCDIFTLPHTVVLNRYGKIAIVSQWTPATARWEFMNGVARLVAEPAMRPASP